MIHNFDDDLAFSEVASCEAFWDAVYRKAFPNLVSHMPCPGDFASQRMGIDRIILLSNGKTLAIDEKKRREVYDDVLLEYVSADTTGAPGWIEKDLAIDYLAYAFMPTQRVYLYPWPQLRRAWLHHKEDWLRRHKTVSADNGSYRTLSVAVPLNDLRSAVWSALVIQL